MKTLVTGAAGFIGMHTVLQLVRAGGDVVGIDNLNDYYAAQLKQDRLSHLEDCANFRFMRMDVSHREAMAALFEKERFDLVIHLAAQAGVRYSIQQPHAYADSNLVGFLNVLEGCRHTSVGHLVYASSSSVYGGNTKMPFSEDDRVDHPVSLYAATKKANELMAEAYSHLYRFSATGLRFFTVYGPWGRPDMAYFLFAKAIHEERPIDVYNNGEMLRDFTFVDDIVEGILRVAKLPREESALHRVFNIGNHEPVPLMSFITTLEQKMGKRAQKRFLPMQPGDVPATYADTKKLRQLTGFAPNTPLEAGISSFVDWFLAYHDRAN